MEADQTADPSRQTPDSAASRRIAALDRWVDSGVARARRSQPLVELMVRCSNIATYSALWLVVALAGLATLPNWRRLTLALLLAVPLEYAVTNGVVKSAFRRSRPSEAVPRHAGKLRRPRTSSFPSGHASAAALGATVLMGSGVLGYISLGLAVLVVSSRLILRLHHATDIIGGLAWGTFLGLLVRAMFGHA